MLRRAALVSFASLAVLSIEGAVHADPPRDGVRTDQLQPASPESLFFRAEGPHAPDPEGAELAGAITLDYGRGLLREVGVDASGTRTTLATLVDHAVLVRLGASITPVHFFSIDASIPLAVYQTGEPGKPYGGETADLAEAQGLGDFRLGMHFRPVDEERFGFLFGGRFWAPIGSERAYLSDKRFRAEVDFGVAGESDKARFGITLNIAPGIFASRTGDRVALSGALHRKLGNYFSVGVEPSIAVVYQAIGPMNTTAIGVQVEPLGAIRVRAGAFRLGLGAGPGFGGGQGAAEFRGIFSLGFVTSGKPAPPPAPPPKDTDLDGITDDADACPAEAGPPSRDPKQNGCPARDRDGDGIRDDEDACPDQVGVKHPNPRANGCPDSDNDGVPDPIDPCKNEPGPTPGGCPRYARLKRDVFAINPPIEFGGGEKLNREAKAAFDEIAGTMRANPSIEQISIGIGSKGVRKALSDRRAQEILLLMQSEHIESGRYEVVFRDDIKPGSVEVKIIK